VHLAAEHRDDVKPDSLYYDVNVKGTDNVCKVAREKGVNTIIFTSSVAVYGFTPVGTDELGKINPFNSYGRTKFEAEEILRLWQLEEPLSRTLVIIRPTVVFGEQNRGNVYNLINQIVSGKFVMVGNGLNRKSMAYVGNLVAFIHHCLGLRPGVHLYNFADKPDYTMIELVNVVSKLVGRAPSQFKLPVVVGLMVGRFFDVMAYFTGKRYPVSSIRIKKFCADSVYSSAINQTGFIPPISLESAIERTIRYEFLEPATGRQVYYTE
jgi:nucleoside-diphosphate-sugar epimerase